MTEAKPPLDHFASSKTYTLLVALTVSAGAVLAIFVVPTTSALGFCSVIFAAIGFVLFESTLRSATNNSESSRRPASASGAPSRHDVPAVSSTVQQLAVLRDVAIAIALMCGLAAILVEPSLTSSMISWEPVYREYDMDWRDVHNHRILQRFLWTIPVSAVSNVLVLIVVSNNISHHVSNFFLNISRPSMTRGIAIDRSSIPHINLTSRILVVAISQLTCHVIHSRCSFVTDYFPSFCDKAL